VTSRHREHTDRIRRLGTLVWHPGKAPWRPGADRITLVTCPRHPTCPPMVPERLAAVGRVLNIQLQLHRGVRHHQVAQNAKIPIQNEFFCVLRVFFKFRFLHDCLICLLTPFPTIWDRGLRKAAGDGCWTLMRRKAGTWSRCYTCVST